MTDDLVEGFETIRRDVDCPPLRCWLIDVNFTEIADLDLEPGDELDPAMLFDVGGVDAIEPAVDQGRPA